MVKSLYRFSASLNGLYGELPHNFCDSPVMSIINLPVLTYLDLSHNNLTGEIPLELQNLKLALFNWINHVVFNSLCRTLELVLRVSLAFPVHSPFASSKGIMSNEEEKMCPLCADEMDWTDQLLKKIVFLIDNNHGFRR
ncbi:hypothetical protein L2E82_47830 [Cichorium intybus]|uniref:Uncharacterized protein n=1 Tax=Cichorium intybus TaxID=13427 RepID=A0ACB8Z0R1_CICIN|nr:hypothetical protein L2E82_47830 [Cichorium intybus]